MASANIDPAGAAALRPPSGSRRVATSPAPASLSGSSPSEKRTRPLEPPPPVPGARSLPLRPAPAPPFDDKCEYASDDVLLFWKPPSVFSQWTPSAFDVLGVRYSCGEPLMMSEKAKLFGDMTSYDKIMAATDPKTHKFLGRNVRPFDYAEWEHRREEIVLTGSYAKFARNHDMKHHLLETGTRLLAEASPFDRVWGIGMSACFPDASDSSKWAASGKNLLGKALKEVRRLLRDHPLSGEDFPASNSPTPPISQPPLHGHRRIHEVATATGCAELEPGDVIGVSAAPLLRVPVETLKAAPSSIPTGPTTSTSPPRVNAVGPKSGTHRSPDPASAPPPPKPPPQELLDRFSEAQRSSFMRVWARLPGRSPLHHARIVSIYYRKFLKNLATKVRPLNSLLKQGVPFKYTPGMVKVVNTLLSELARPPILVFPDWAAIEDNSRPLRLCSDACIDGFGSSLEQGQLDGLVRPNVYISRATLPAERNWTVLDLEAGGIVWAIKCLRGYLWSTKFIIYSDHKALESIGKVGEHNARVQRWLEFLSNFTYTLKYRKGSANGNADFLSRLPLPAQDTDKTGPDCIDGVDQAGVFLIWACGRNYHSSSTPEVPLDKQPDRRSAAAIRNAGTGVFVDCSCATGVFAISGAPCIPDFAFSTGFARDFATHDVPFADITTDCGCPSR
ncbi:unnamed protein product [Ectocarpus sp. CCAP 1310/34]|nr:unnamed protein product [Ectocarpus sp. CCAP 1310/34]